MRGIIIGKLVAQGGVLAVLAAVHNQYFAAIAGIAQCPEGRGIDGVQAGFPAVGHHRGGHGGIRRAVDLQFLVFFYPGHVRPLAQSGKYPLFCPYKQHVGNPVRLELYRIHIGRLPDEIEYGLLALLGFCLQGFEQEGGPFFLWHISAQQGLLEGLGLDPVL